MSTKEEKFETSYKKLQEILDWFESDKFDLDKAETKFKEGSELVEALVERLKKAELKVEKLEKSLDK